MDFVVNGGAVGMAVDQNIDVQSVHELGDGALVHIHDAGGLLAGFHPAACAQAVGEALAGAQGQVAQDKLDDRMAQLATQMLIGQVIGTELVAVYQGHTMAIQRDDGFFRQQVHTKPLGKSLADQEVAVAMLEVDRDSGCGQALQQVESGADVWLDWRVIADPHLHEIAEKVDGVSRSQARLKREQPARDLRCLLAQVEIREDECFARQGALFGCFDARDLVDQHVLTRHVAVARSHAGRLGGDRIDHMHAIDHFAEYAVTPAVRRGAGVIQEGIVLKVDEELAGGRMRVWSAGHGNAAAHVRKAVGRLIFNRCLVRLVGHVRRQTTTLDHEAGNDAVEQRAVIEALINISQYIGHGFRGSLGIQLNDDIAKAGGNLDARVV